MKTLIGIPTFGNLEFTQLCVQGIRETVTKPYDLLAVVGKPGDAATAQWLISEGIALTQHTVNFGLPAALNDIYQGFDGYDNIIIIGNDVIPYPRAINRLLEVARTTDWEWICATQVDVQTLCAVEARARDYFSTDGKFLYDFEKGRAFKPWMFYRGWETEPLMIVPGALKDVHNLCLYKRAAFDKIGYVDVNFYPAYFEDNDYARRAVNAGVKYCSVNDAQYFHFWSRTLHQGTGGSTDKQFAANRRFYQTKWGGDFAAERWTVPFNGQSHVLAPGIELPGVLKITSREQEAAIAEYWRSLP